MRLLVTSGGTREPIDEVRFLGNVSSGRTGAYIVEEALRRYHTVHWLRGQQSEGPTEWMANVGLLDSELFSSAEDLRKRVLGKLEVYTYDAVVHSAAVADYTVKPQSGKVPSTLGSWSLELVPAPKVVDAMVPVLGGATLVVFKLESTDDEAELLRRARNTMGRTGAELVVANSTSGIGTEGHAAVIASQSEVLKRPVQRRELACALLDLLEERCKNRD